MNYDSSNVRKTPFAQSLQQFAGKKIADAIGQLGGQLPCHVVAIPTTVGGTPTNGQIVTVSFDINSAPFTLPQISIPIAAWLYDWIPVRVGDSGLTLASDVYLGGISGLGGGAADLSRPGNLSSLLFLPVAKAAWKPPGGDPLVRVVQGPDGVLIQDLAAAVTISINSKAQTIVMVAPGGMTLNGVKIADDGFTKIPQDLSVGTGGAAVTSYLNHTHGGVQTGGGNTGAPTPGT